MPITYHALKVPTSLLVQAVGFKLRNILALLLLRLNSLLLCSHLGVDLHVELEQVIDGVLLECLLVAILLICQSQQSILLTPVSQVCKMALAQSTSSSPLGDVWLDHSQFIRTTSQPLPS